MTADRRRRAGKTSPDSLVNPACRGRRVTCYEAIRDDMVHAGAEYVDAEVVVDGNLITSRKPSDLPAFCAAIVKALAERT